MTKYLIPVGLAVATLINSVSARTIFDQTTDNIHVIATDYRDDVGYPVLYGWKASDFYKYGMNPVTVTITNNGAKDIIMSGKAFRSKNKVGIVGDPYMKPWRNKVITSGLQAGALAPLIYGTFQGFFQNNIGMLPLCWIWTFGLGAIYSPILTLPLIMDYLPKNKLVRTSIILAATLVSLINLSWQENKKIMAKMWASNMFMVTDSITIKPGESISKVVVVSTEYKVLQLPIIHTDTQSNTKITQVIPIGLIK